jgi:hypothetical protein
LLRPSRSTSPLPAPSSSSSSSSSRRADRTRQWATTPPSPDDLDAVMGFEPDTLPPRQVKRKMAWPFQRFDAPPLLDGTLACDCGFDPFRIAKSQKELFALREAEIKHARLAMLAAVGWPASELTHYTISKVLGLNDLLADNERAPSVLNGGLQVPSLAPPPPFPPFSPVLLTFVVCLTFSPSPSHAGAPFPSTLFLRPLLPRLPSLRSPLWTSLSCRTTTSWWVWARSSPWAPSSSSSTCGDGPACQVPTTTTTTTTTHAPFPTLPRVRLLFLSQSC